MITTRLGLKNHVVRADRDIWLASYPRTGNTWIRALIASAIQGRAAANLTELDRVVPDRHILCPARKLIVDRKGPVIVKTHLPYFLEKPSCKVLYVIRDPLDVAWSFFKYHRKMEGYKQDFNVFLEAFVNGQLWPGCWAAHARGWLTPSKDVAKENTLVVRYEDLVAKDVSVLGNALDFLGIPLRCRDARQIFEWNSVEKLQAAEKAGNRGIESGWFIGGSGKLELDPASPAAAAYEKFKDRNRDVLGAYHYL